MEHNIRSQFYWSFQFANNYWKPLLAYLFTELISLASGLMFVWMTKVAIDTAIATTKSPPLLENLIWLSIFLILSFICNVLGSWIMERGKASMLIDLQNKIVDAQMRAKWQNSANWHTGDLMVRTISDSQEIVNVLGGLWVNIISTFLRLVAPWTLFYTLDPMLAVMLLISIPLILLSKNYMRKLKKLNKNLKDEESELGTVIQENLSHRLFLRSIGWGDERWRQVLNRQNAIYERKLKLLSFSTFSKVMMGLILNVSYLLIFIFGSLKLQSGAITFGTMSAFIQLVARIQGPALNLMAQLPVLIRFRTALDRVIDTLILPLEFSKADNSIPQIDSLNIRNLTFGFNNDQVLKNINLIFKQGKVTALLGPSGQGKSTLLRIMIGLCPIKQGTVLLTVDNQEIHMDATYRCNFSYVPQGQKLLTGTILYNLIGSEDSISEDKVKNAIHLACADFVFDLPAGLQTYIAESGHGLSEGQAQRLGIARAILQNRPIWLFDEVTSALDKNTAEKLINNLIKIGKNKIVVFVTHEESFTNLFDVVYRIV